MLQRGTLARAASVVLAAALTGAAGSSQPAGGAASAMSRITIPAGYRDWTLFAVAREEGTLQDLRGILANDTAIKAARTGRRPFPDGSVLVRIAWSYAPLAESERAFGRLQSFVAGKPKNGVQFMVKDSHKYAATGGWGFAQFNDGKPALAEGQRVCFACHSIVKGRDFVFTHYVR